MAASEQDYVGKPISIGDIVDLQDGKLKGKGGTVKYIVRGMLFLHVRCGPAQRSRWAHAHEWTFTLASCVFKRGWSAVHIRCCR